MIKPILARQPQYMTYPLLITLHKSSIPFGTFIITSSNRKEK